LLLAARGIAICQRLSMDRGLLHMLGYRHVCWQGFGQTEAWSLRRRDGLHGIYQIVQLEANGNLLLF
jgi:hypothetical protein